MANLWNKLNDDPWTPVELRSAAVLRDGAVQFVDNARAQRDALLIYPHAGENRVASWALLAQAEARVRINDTSLETGIRVLADRDAIRIAEMHPVYYSTESLAAVETYADEEPVYCARCRTLINKGDAAVRCNKCGVWHHEDPASGRNCWTYSSKCTSCDQSTDLDAAGYSWTPEVLWS